VDANITNRFAVAHFAAVQPEAAPGACTVAARTIDPGYDLVVMAAHGLDRPPDEVRAGQGRAEQVYHARIAAGTPLVFTKFAAVYDSRFASGDLAALCSAELSAALSAGYEAIRAAHVDRWAALWDACDLVIDGDWRHNKCTGLTLAGPVKFVYTGEVELDELDMSGEID